jgi:phosphatidylinositol-3-phosphatase
MLPPEEPMHRILSLTSCLAVAGCALDADPATQAAPITATASVIKHVFVIALENHGASDIYGNTASAPFINQTLMPIGGRATNFVDRLPALVSEPHYVWMEAGTNAFADHTFTTDNNPSASNSTASTAHLSTQITAAGATWLSYQEGINATTGACPIAGSGNYAPKHDPFIFFRDVAGATPSKTNALCAAHHKPLTALAADLAADTVAAYNFITPNLCHDMHSNTCAGSADPIKQGDDWLAANVPAIQAYVAAHQGVLWIVWDEPAGSSGTIPLLVLGPHVKANFASALTYSHGSLVRSVEQILALPTLATVASDNGFADFFAAGFYP